MDGLQASYSVADKGYGADLIIEGIERQGGEAVIPPRSSRKEQRTCSRSIYAARNLVERCFLKLKAFRRVATRYERLAATYASMIHPAASGLGLNG